MKVVRYLLCLISLIMIGCSTEDSFLESGVVSVEENVYNDIDHNRWTYEMMSQHYLWNEDMADSLSLDFTISPKSFFEGLLSDQDRFSWCEANMNYRGEDLGFHYQTYEIHGSKVDRVLYVYSNFLLEQGLKRGDYVVVNSDSIEVGNFEDGRFVATKVIARESIKTKGANLAPSVPLDSVYTIDNKRIGYFIYNEFDSTTDVNQIAIRMGNSNIDELIIDLRYNPGGYVNTSSSLASLLAPRESLGKIYQLQRYNDIQTKLKQNRGGSGVDTVFLGNGIVTQSRNLNLKRLVVLTTKNTASASESLIIGLRPYMKVVTIGTKTCGKDVGSYTIADNNYKYQLQPITFRYYNALNQVTPVTGIVPDYEVADDLNHKRGDLNEALLKTAVNYLIDKPIYIPTRSENGLCKEIGKSSIEIENNL